LRNLRDKQRQKTFTWPLL